MTTGLSANIGENVEHAGAVPVREPAVINEVEDAVTAVKVKGLVVKVGYVNIVKVIVSAGAVETSAVVDDNPLPIAIETGTAVIAAPPATVCEVVATLMVCVGPPVHGVKASADENSPTNARIATNQKDIFSKVVSWS